jgi:hypothetical protein
MIWENSALVLTSYFEKNFSRQRKCEQDHYESMQFWTYPIFSIEFVL